LLLLQVKKKLYNMLISLLNLLLFRTFDI
jgi:hypothetical protein